MNKRQRLFALLLAIVAGALPPLPAGAAPLFQGLGHLRPEHEQSIPIAASEDGRVVIGESGPSTNPEFFVWSEGAGLRRFSDLAGPGAVGRRPVDVSGDGSVIVGMVTDPFAGPNRAFRWSRAGGFESLRPLNNESGAGTAVTAVSADGQVALGQHTSPGGRIRGVRWTPQGVSPLGEMSSTNPFLHPTDVSPDGSFVVGFGNVEGESHQHAFRWTAARGVLRLDEPEGVTISRATAVSADGSVVVGDMYMGTVRLAFRWTSSGGMAPLRPADAARRDAASDVSADGQIVVGFADDVGGFIWDQRHGMRGIRDVLVQDYGLADQLTGWQNLVARSISGNGTILVGFGTNPAGEAEAFRAVLPEPGAAALVLGCIVIGLGRRPRRPQQVSGCRRPA